MISIIFIFRKVKIKSQNHSFALPLRTLFVCQQISRKTFISLIDYITIFNVITHHQQQSSDKNTHLREMSQSKRKKPIKHRIYIYVHRKRRWEKRSQNRKVRQANKTELLKILQLLCVFAFIFKLRFFVCLLDGDGRFEQIYLYAYNNLHVYLWLDTTYVFEGWPKIR